jgi:hypothetical protein
VVLGGVDELRKMGLGMRERRLPHVTIMTIEVHQDNASASKDRRPRRSTQRVPIAIRAAQ